MSMQNASVIIEVFRKQDTCGTGTISCSELKHILAIIGFDCHASDILMKQLGLEDTLHVPYEQFVCRLFDGTESGSRSSILRAGSSVASAGSQPSTLRARSRSQLLVKHSTPHSSAIAKWLEAHIDDAYDYLQPTYINYRREDSHEVVGEFADIRKGLDFDYHGCYIAERQMLQDMLIWNSAGRGTVHEKPWVIFTAGAMGAGKGHTVDWMNRQGYFPFADIVHIDTDFFRLELPEWPGYVRSNAKTAGVLTQRESGYLVEIASEVSMRNSKNVWIDGSLRDAEWYTHVFKSFRENHPQYKIAIFHVLAKWKIILDRAASRGQKTGRVVPHEDLKNSFDSVPKSVEQLSPLADFVIHVDNSGDVPVLLSGSIRLGNNHTAIKRDDWAKIKEQFADLAELQDVRVIEELIAFTEKLKHDFPVLVFSKTYCSYSTRAKQILEEIVGSSHMHVVELDKLTVDRGNTPGVEGGAGVALQTQLTDMTGQSTVPYVYLAGELIGGCGALEELKAQNVLETKISNATALYAAKRSHVNAS